MEHILYISYGKDSLAAIRAIELLGWPLDRIVHAEVWATDTIPADLPPMVEFKAKADKIIKERWGIEVEHVCAMRNGEKLTYEKMFYHVPQRRRGGSISMVSQCTECPGAIALSREEHTAIKGFPNTLRSWCKKLKMLAFLPST